MIKDKNFYAGLSESLIAKCTTLLRYYAKGEEKLEKYELKHAKMIEKDLDSIRLISEFANLLEKGAEN